MAKQLYEIKDFSGGLNAYADPRDIKDTEFSQNWNIVVDKNGILRVIGSAVHHIEASNIDNPQFNAGYGLFQFNVDYGYNEVDGNFNYGLEQGTVAAVDGSSPTLKFDLEATNSVNINNDDYYKGMTVFFFSSSNNLGQSRVVSAYDASEQEITLATATTGNITTSDKYMIFKWKSVNFNNSTSTTDEKDYITDGISVGTATTISPNESGFSSPSDYFLIDKINGVSSTTEESVSGGHIQYMGEGETNLTLKAGVEYTLSFDCGFKYNWRNIVCQGDSSSNYAGWCPWIELFSETVTNSSNGVDTHLNTGLSLMYDNNWAKQKDWEGTNQAYISNQTKNYIENGDFRDGTNHWTEVDASNEMAFLTGNHPYGGHINCGGLTLSNPDIVFTGNVPNTYIKSDAMALDVGSWYRLNFVYKGRGGFQYQVYDTTSSINIIPWTKHGTSSTSDSLSLDDTPFQYPFEANTDYGNITDYIYFYIPEYGTSSSATAKNIVLSISPSDGTMGSSSRGIVHASAFTIRKAYNDLVTMSRNVNGANNPFVGATEEFSRYTTKFKIPKEYNDASDWILKIHSGEWDFHPDARFSNSAMQQLQEVYFDNIKISASDNDTFTLLSSNEQINSQIVLNSTNQGNTWNSIIKYEETNSEFNFNYANGVLRISDGNFKTSNKNKMLYYQKEKAQSDLDNSGWKTKTNFLLNPPSISFISHVPEDDIAAANPESQDLGAFDGISYCNKLYKDVTYSSPGIFETDGTSYLPAIETDWKLNSFGQNNPTGIVTRYFWSADPTEQHNFSIVKIATGTQGDSYIASQESIEDSNNYTAHMKHITAAGFSPMTADDAGGVCGMVAVDVQEVYNQALWPFKILIKSENVGNEDTPETYAIGMKQYCTGLGYDVINEIGSNENTVEDVTVHKIEYNIDYELNCYKRSNSTGDAWPRRYLHELQVPWFEVEAGKISGGGQDTEDLIKEGDTTSLESRKSTNIGYNAFVNALRLDEAASTESQMYQSNGGNITITELTEDNEQTAARLRINFSGEFTWDINDTSNLISLRSNDDIVLSIKDHIGHGEHESDEVQRCLQNGIQQFKDVSRTCAADNTTDANRFGTACTFVAKPLGPLGTAGGSDDLAYTEWHVSQGDGSVSTDNYIETNFDNHQLVYRPAEGVTESGGNAYAIWTRYFVNDVNVTFHSPEFAEMQELAEESGTSLTCDSSSCAVLFDFVVPQDIAPSGWAERSFDVATSVVNQYGEESCLNINNSSTLPQAGTFSPTVCPNITFYLGSDNFKNDDIHTTKIYMKDNESDIWYLQFYVNHKEGTHGTFYSSTSGKSVSGGDHSFINGSSCKMYILNNRYVKDFNEVNSYESETLVSQEDAILAGNAGLSARYKTSIVANNRLYVGNIMQNSKIHGDRMLKSPPNKYGVLPSSNFIDVAINDGDEITALSFFKDRLLQFKKRKVFVINTSGDYEFLEDTFHNVGVQGQFSVTTTPHGVVWANEQGCYLYDGKAMTNLTQDKIPNSESYANPGSSVNRWCANSSAGDCVIGYDSNKDTILVNFTKINTALAGPSGATYHFGTKSWSLLFGVWNNSTTRTNTGNMSNMVTDVNGDIIFYHTSEVSDDTDQDINTIRKWNHESNSTLSTKNATFTTKDITFGNISARKKIYKVYITYRVRESEASRTNIDSAISVTGAINGSNSFDVTFSDTSTFAFGQSNSSGTTCYGSSTLDETDGKWKTAALVPSTPSDLNNISSLMLKFSGTMPYDTEINDISISYRLKSVK